MIFSELSLKDAYIIEIERLKDERGFFARSWCQREMKEHGLNARLVQCNISFNAKRGTLRGMHYQAKPFEEAKLIRCTVGSVYDVIVDLRPESKSFKQHIGIALTADSRKMVFVPEGFAHGFLTLEDNTEVFYQMSEFYAPDHASGFRWNDPAFGIRWPRQIRVISERDRTYADFDSSRS